MGRPVCMRGDHRRDACALRCYSGASDVSPGPYAVACVGVFGGRAACGEFCRSPRSCAEDDEPGEPSPLAFAWWGLRVLLFGTLGIFVTGTLLVRLSGGGLGAWIGAMAGGGAALAVMLRGTGFQRGRMHRFMTLHGCDARQYGLE